MNFKTFSLIISRIIFLLYTGVMTTWASDDVDAAKQRGSPYEYIVENIPGRLKMLSSKFFKNGINDVFIDLYAPVSAENELCRNQSLLYKESFQHFHTWALKMWDSSGKLPSGILDGHFHDLGNYEECLDVSKSGPYHVKYCIVQVKNLLPTALLHPEFEKAEAILYGSLPIIKSNLYLARCVPASCGNKDLERYFTSVISEYNMSVEIGKYSCTASNESDPYTILDYGTLTFLFMTIAFLSLSTIIHRLSPGYKKKGLIMKLLMCFSLYSNLNQIFTTNDMKSNLSFLTGLRGVSSILVILTHVAICMTSFPRINFLRVVKDLFNPSIIFVLASSFTLAVDVFFIMSGVLISYLHAKNTRLGIKFNFKLYCIRRILRIFPACVIQIATFITISFRYAGAGPLWKMVFGLTKDNCLKNWWTNLLFINNFVNQDEMCIGTNWYLAVYMQLYMIGPLIVIPMTKWKVFRKYAIPLLIILFNLWTFYDSYTNGYRTVSVADVNIRPEKTNKYFYITTNSRISGWLLGIYLGYILQKSKLQKTQLSKLKLWFGWSLTALMHLLAVLSMYHFMSNHEHNNLIESIYNGFHRTFYAASICWLIYACGLGYGGFVYDFLTSYPMQVLGRLSFMAYLSHMLVLLGGDSMTMISLQYQPLIELKNAISTVVVCFILSFFLSLILELPYLNLGRVLATAVDEGTEVRKDENSSSDMIKRKHD